MKKRIVACMLVLVIALVQLIPVLADENDALEVWVRNKYYDIVTTAANAFTEKTGYPVKVVEAANMSDDLALAISAGNTPDVVSIDCILVPYYASIGALKDVTDQVNSLEFKDAIPAGSYEIATYDGALYAVPFGPDSSVLVYNKEMFAANGLDPENPPKTWDEIIEAAKACTNGDTYGYAFPGNAAGGMMFGFGPYIWANGGDFYSADGTECLLDSPEAIGALQLIVDMVHEYGVTPDTITSYVTSEIKDGFAAQKFAMLAQGNSYVGNVINHAFDFDAGIALLPSPDGEHFSSYLGGDSMAIMNGTDKADIAWQFVEYCLSEEVQVNQFAARGLMPARTDLFDNEVFQGVKEWEIVREAMSIGKTPYSQKYNELLTPFLEEVQYALNQEKTAEQAFTDAAAEMEAIMAE